MVGVAAAPSRAVVVVDVLRAFTTASVAYERGAAGILLVPDVEAALALKRADPTLLLAGESDGQRIAGFDLDNSPSELAALDLEGATLVLKTTNGVPATLRALGQGRVFVAALRNARATRAYLAAEGIPSVEVICSSPDGDDDRACAELIAGAIDLAEARRRVRASRAARKFLDPDRPSFRESDLEMCLAEPESAFVMEVLAGPPPWIRATRAPMAV